MFTKEYSLTHLMILVVEIMFFVTKGFLRSNAYKLVYRDSNVLLSSLPFCYIVDTSVRVNSVNCSYLNLV